MLCKDFYTSIRQNDLRKEEREKGEFTLNFFKVLSLRARLALINQKFSTYLTHVSSDASHLLFSQVLEKEVFLHYENH